MIRLTETAEADLADIWLHIAMASSEERATRYIRSVQTALMRLEEFPLSGPPRDHLAAGLRTLLHGSYAAYYLFSGEDIVVVRVVHGARDLDALAASDGFGS
ncbi:type II toxin-antitoxin system RelE/ParE family toxin [Sphingobium sp. CR2-8]|uniref:type II toxin-antitoxin system RelE/ParE family toxin n=1 Tax=Sphingobium sp. CR2-8 TaxID=1306534 RepID=UPI002DB80CEC|nr:type II toxin-antitoxin system RelE/ParE family toxin [Sphingobium sp. CR2-8]MEC3908962.1 type II toxin-antitoxin system RelE/ParE family toxin [Sphingobium sp. CR2-8]